MMWRSEGKNVCVINKYLVSVDYKILPKTFSYLTNKKKLSNKATLSFFVVIMLHLLPLTKCLVDGQYA